MHVIRPILVSLTAVLVACGGGGDGGGGVVNPPPAGTLDHITVTPTTLALNAGQSQTLAATGLAADNSVVATTAFSYSSANESIATVTSTGRVLGLAAGTTTVTVNGSSGSVSKTATVAVTISGTLPAAVSVVAGAETNDFTPKDIAIQRNGVVTWTFPGTTHNVDFQGATGAPANIGNTGSSTTGVSRTFANAGSFQYVCSLHSGMGGSVIVP